MAIQISCDTVFYALAYDSWRAQGGFAATSDARDPFVAATTGLGLGTRTGIDLPGEATGRIPGRAWKKASWEATKAESCRRARTGYPDVAAGKQAAYFKQVAVENCASGYLLRPGDAANFSIGQGDVGVTPLQVAVMYAAIANGGTVLTPRVGSSVVDPATGRDEAVAAGPRRRAPLSAQVDCYLRAALRDTVTLGSVRNEFRAMPGWPVAGKTGTGRGGRQAGHLLVRVVRPGRQAALGRVGRRDAGWAGRADRRPGRPWRPRGPAHPALKVRPSPRRPRTAVVDGVADPGHPLGHLVAVAGRVDHRDDVVHVGVDVEGRTRLYRHHEVLDEVADARGTDRLVLGAGTHHEGGGVGRGAFGPERRDAVDGGRVEHESTVGASARPRARTVVLRPIGWLHG